MAMGTAFAAPADRTWKEMNAFVTMAFTGTQSARDVPNAYRRIRPKRNA